MFLAKFHLLKQTLENKNQTPSPAPPPPELNQTMTRGRTDTRNEGVELSARENKRGSWRRWWTLHPQLSLPRPPSPSADRSSTQVALHLKLMALQSVMFIFSCPQQSNWGGVGRGGKKTTTHRCHWAGKFGRWNRALYWRSLTSLQTFGIILTNTMSE